VATHTYTVLQAPTAVLSGGSLISSAANLTANYGGVVTVQITNGATGPTSPCVATLQVSGDNTNFYPIYSGTADPTNSATTTFFWDLPPGVMYVRVQFTGNTAQPVTASAQIQILATI
jgi:hypothetical protein